jgi:cupin fold WbuC family metalloprotein
MIIDTKLLDELTAQAKASPRLRMNLDLRNSAADGTQRMLNAIEPGSPLPIHRHTKSSETVVCLRGHLREIFYSDSGEVTEVIDLTPGGPCVALNIPLGQWHTVEVLESGTVILECKDGAYEPLAERDVMDLNKSVL